MLVSEHNEFKAVMHKLGITFERIVDASLLEIYWDALRDIPLREIQDCAAEHIRTGKFFPKPRDLRYRPDGGGFVC